MLINGSLVERQIAVPQVHICTRKNFEWILTFSTRVPPVLEVPFASNQHDNLSGAEQFKNTIDVLRFCTIHWRFYLNLLFGVHFFHLFFGATAPSGSGPLHSRGF